MVCDVYLISDRLKKGASLLDTKFTLTTTTYRELWPLAGFLSVPIYLVTKSESEIESSIELNVFNQ